MQPCIHTWHSSHRSDVRVLSACITSRKMCFARDVRQGDTQGDHDAMRTSRGRCFIAHLIYCNAGPTGCTQQYTRTYSIGKSHLWNGAGRRVCVCVCGCALSFIGVGPALKWISDKTCHSILIKKDYSAYSYRQLRLLPSIREGDPGIWHQLTASLLLCLSSKHLHTRSPVHLSKPIVALWWCMRVSKSDEGN